MDCSLDWKAHAKLARSSAAFVSLDFWLLKHFWQPCWIFSHLVKGSLKFFICHMEVIETLLFMMLQKCFWKKRKCFTNFSETVPKISIYDFFFQTFVRMFSSLDKNILMIFLSHIQNISKRSTIFSTGVPFPVTTFNNHFKVYFN